MATLNEFIERGMSYFQGIESANTKIAALEKDLLAATTARDEAVKASTESSQQIATLTTERDQAQADALKLKAEVDSLKANAKTTEELAAVKAREIVAAQGIPVATAPTGATAGNVDQGQQLNAIRAQIAAEKDPTKRGILARQARELRNHGELFKP